MELLNTINVSDTSNNVLAIYDTDTSYDNILRTPSSLSSGSITLDSQLDTLVKGSQRDADNSDADSVDNLVNNNEISANIMQKRIHSTVFNKILSHIGIDNVPYTSLHNLQSMLYEFIEEKFPVCTLCHDIHLKYKLLVNTYINNLSTAVKTMSISKRNDANEYVKSIDMNTLYLFKTMDLYDEIKHENIINKFKRLIDICINVTILTTFWRHECKNLRSILDITYVYFEEVIRDLLIPYIKEIRFYIENKRICEPRILTGHYDENQKTPSRLQTPVRTSRISRSDTHSQLSRTESWDDVPDYGTHSEKSVNNITGDRKQISFDELSAIIGQSYGNNPDLECSTALDIFASYLRGQKQLYIEAKNYSEKYLNLLSFPAIIISAAVGLLALILTSRTGFIIVAIMSATNSVIMSLISLLKLDAKSEAHRTSAYHFDKLETKCSFLSGRIMFDSNSDDINEVIATVETKINEIKEINHFVLPEHVRRMYPKTYSSNIFTTVKKLYVEEVILKNNLKNIINDMIIKSRKIDKTPEDVAEIQELKIAQDKLLNKILSYKKKYLDLDSSLKYEIKKNDYIKKIRAYTCLNIFNLCFCNMFNDCLLIAGPKKPSDYSSETRTEFDPNDV